MGKTLDYLDFVVLLDRLELKPSDKATRDFIKALSKTTAQQINATPPRERPLLQIAARSFNTSLVVALLEAGADPNQCAPNGNSILAEIMHYPQAPVDILRHLLGAGADPAFVNPRQYSIMDLAARNFGASFAAEVEALILSRATPPAEIPRASPRI